VRKAAFDLHGRPGSGNPGGMFTTTKFAKGAAASGLALLTLATPAVAKNIVLGDGANTVNGTPKADLIVGNGGNDTINARGGDDRVTGGTDDDRINGWRGNDVLFGNSGNDWIHGWAGNDLIRGNVGDDTLIGDANRAGDRFSKDTIYGAFGNDTIRGGDAFDQLYGGAGTDTIHGEAGADLLAGGAQDDVLKGNANDDRIFANQGNDKVYGGSGDDEVSVLTQRDNGGDGGTDYVDAGPGRDVIRSRDLEADTIKCGPGKDVVYADVQDVFAGASEQRPTGSCEQVVLGDPTPGEALQEDQTEAPAEEDVQAPAL
jgi:Ca2+-binding RTX toxin-like protein